MRIKHAINIFALGVLSILVSCSDDKEASNTGKLSVQMTDAPFPTDLVKEANVTIDKIEIRKSEENEGSPFITLSQQESSMNLLELTNGVTASLVDLEIPVGSYDLVRIYVKKANVVLSDGYSYELTVPSGAETGIKVFINPGIEVAGGLTAELLLDFDVSSSFVAQGDINSPAGVKGFIFTPTIKAANLSTAGRIAGTVSDAMTGLEGAQVSIYVENELYTTTFTNADGSYALLGLPAGTYDVVVEAEGFTSNTIEDVEVIPANVTNKDFELIAQ